MSYIRSKQIPPGTGNWYDYEVVGIRQGSKVRQKVIRYIGRSDSKRPVVGNAPVALPDTTVTEPDTPIENEARVSKMKTPASRIASAMCAYYNGQSLDGLQQQVRQDYNEDMSESNFWNWVKRFTKEAINQTKGFHPEVGDTWIADETYMKLKKRNVYFWDIICPKTNYILATHVSFNRCAGDARTLMRLARIRAGKYPKVVITDKLASYISGVGDEFGTRTEHKQGGPFGFKVDGESTAEIERFHKTLEQRTRVMEKFKDIESIRLLTGGWLVNYNFCKQNIGCGNIPPAQAASKVVPLKDWNDVVVPEGAPEVDYKVRLSQRKTVKKGYPVMDATLTPFEVDKEVVPK